MSRRRQAKGLFWRAPRRKPHPFHGCWGDRKALLQKTQPCGPAHCGTAAAGRITLPMPLPRIGFGLHSDGLRFSLLRENKRKPYRSGK